MSESGVSTQPYVLGLDLGSASLGWALIGIDAMERPSSLIRAGVRIFEPGVDGSALDIQQEKTNRRQLTAAKPGCVVANCAGAWRGSASCLVSYKGQVFYRLTIPKEQGSVRSNGIEFLTIST